MKVRDGGRREQGEGGKAGEVHPKAASAIHHRAGHLASAAALYCISCLTVLTF